MVMQIGFCNLKNQYLFGSVPLSCVDSEKDLEVTFNTSFNFKDHVGNRLWFYWLWQYCSIAKANRTIAWVTRSIISRYPSVMLSFA